MANAKKILENMTIREKIGQLSQYNANSMSEDGNLSKKRCVKQRSFFIGKFNAND